MAPPGAVRRLATSAATRGSASVSFLSDLVRPPMRGRQRCSLWNERTKGTALRRRAVTRLSARDYLS